MQIWQLTPICPYRHDWRLSNYTGVAIVRAEGEFAARRRTQIMFSQGVGRNRGLDAPTSPWRDPRRVHCLSLNASNFSEFGPEEILDPDLRCGQLGHPLAA